jgi:hypothetical protein
MTTPTNLSPELTMVILAGRMEMTVDQVSLLRTLTAETDWSRVLRLASAHGVRPLLLRSLEAHCPDLVPDEVLTHLRMVNRFNVVKALQQTAELDRLTALLEQEGIPLFPYKGVALGEQLYGDAALRESGDIDIIVPKAQAMDAVALVRSSGYRPLYDLSPRQEQIYVLGVNHYNLVHVDKSISLEVHWDIITPHHGIPIRWQAFWDEHEASRLRNENDKASLDSQPQFLLLLLLLHGGKHRWESLKWLVDIAQYIAHYPSLRWKELLQEAKNLRVERLALSGLNLANCLYDIPLPAEVEQRMSIHNGVTDLTAEVLRVLEAPWNGDGATDFGYQLRIRDRWQDRVRYGWRIVTMLNFQDIEGEEQRSRFDLLRRGVRIFSNRGVRPTAQLLVQMAAEATSTAHSKKPDP